MTKYNLKINFFLIIKILIIFHLITLSLLSYGNTTNDEHVVLGKDSAPIKIKIFSSLTCPHCANFHINVVPKIKENYVETGIVQLIFIDFPLDKAAFNASKLLHCLDQKKQIAYLDTIYERQEKWMIGSNMDEINSNLKKIVEILGIDLKKFNKCVNDKVIADKILNGRIQGQEKYSINSTPTIIINEKKLEGSVDFKNIKKKIEKLI